MMAEFKIKLLAIALITMLGSARVIVASHQLPSFFERLTFAPKQTSIMMHPSEFALKTRSINTDAEIVGLFQENLLQHIHDLD
jgi:hypothetical protein